MELTKSDKIKIRTAARLSGVYIANGKDLTPTDYGKKTSTGLANIFLQQLELQFDLTVGNLTVDV